MQDAERRKYHFARKCYDWRDELTPKAKIPWPKRFEQIYSQTLADYMRECRATKMRERVIAYEIATFGRSSLGDAA